MILKGLLDIDDAKVGATSGADAIIVSNHGGRQLDGACSSIAALPAIANAVGGRIEVLFDGGVRSGQDVLKALACGAKSCLIGRAYLYGLGALGEKGVHVAFEILRNELDVSMALTGVSAVRDISRAMLMDRHEAIPPDIFSKLTIVQGGCADGECRSTDGRRRA